MENPYLFRKHMPCAIRTAKLGMIRSDGKWFKRVCKKPAGVLMVAPKRSFSKGAPHHFPKAHALRYGPLGMIGCIFAENGPLEGGTESSFSGTGWGAKRFQMDFRRPQSVHFRRGPPTIFRKQMPSGMGTESLGVIIRGDWALRRWIQVSEVPAGVLRVISCVILTYTRTFSNGEPILFRKHMGPVLYAQHAYSWRNDLWKVNFKRVCKKPAGVLMVIWSPSFSKGAPHHFPKAHALRYGQFGNDRIVYSRRMGPYKVALNQVSVVPAGVLRVISDGFLAPIRAFSKGAPHHFPKANALRYGHRKFGSDRMYIRGEWALRRWH